MCPSPVVHRHDSWSPVAYSLQTSSAPPLFNTQNVPDDKHRTPSTCLTVTRSVLWNELTLAVQQVSLYKKKPRDIVSLHASLLLSSFVPKCRRETVMLLLDRHTESHSHDGNIDRSICELYCLFWLPWRESSDSLKCRKEPGFWLMQEMNTFNDKIVLMLNNQSNFNALTKISWSQFKPVLWHANQGFITQIGQKH